jgi:hypothetical protein
MSRSFRSMTAMALLWWLLLAAQPAGQSPLVGRWDAEARSGGGLGIWFELADQGACQQTVGAMVDATWSLEGEGLTVSIPNPAGQPVVQHASVSFQGPTLTEVFEGLPKHMTRWGPSPAAPSIVGVWSYPHPAGGTAYEEYTEDGRMLFRLPIKTTSCRWTVDADRLALTVGKESTKSRWRIAGDTLTMEAETGARTFRRERAGAIPPASSVK